MTEPKQLSSEELAEIKQRRADWPFQSQPQIDIDSLLSHIAALQIEILSARTTALEIVDAEHAQSCHFLGDRIAESTRTLLIEVVKGKRDHWLEMAICQPGWSQHKRASDEIIAALEAAELKQDSESVKIKAQT